MKHLLLLFISLLICQTAAPQKKSLKFYLEQHQGKKIDTIFRIGTSDSIKAGLPATLVFGRFKGPTFTIVSGARASEQSAVQSLLKLRREINPEKLAGSLIIIPIMNLDSFFSSCPNNGLNTDLNLDQYFPETQKSIVNGLAADFITTQIFDATDIFLDIRSAGSNEDLISYAGYYHNSELPQQALLCSRLCEISGLGTIVSRPYLQPSGQPSKQIFRQAVRLGIPALSITAAKRAAGAKSEIGPATNAVYNMLALLKMYQHKLTPQAALPKRFFNDQLLVASPAEGLFYSSAKAGSSIIKGEEIGYITDVFGRNVKIITAPADGTILKKRTGLAASTSAPLFWIGCSKSSSEKKHEK
ncbi:succinylglutamate desuccinylase/aspartoacylase family protein [Flavobacterium anhuiense]|uniref:succinylglutamate desuccinylase/aspartoacylase family protein n=1 Tax=Flavobacterium anhuiense TaxID=459526 RepID=UPI0034D97BF1